jgi:hypothetical protein
MFPKQRLDISDTGHHNYVTKKTKETEENSEEPYQSRSSAPDFEDSSLGLGIDWDSNRQARFVRWVMYEKNVDKNQSVSSKSNGVDFRAFSDHWIGNLRYSVSIGLDKDVVSSIRTAYNNRNIFASKSNSVRFSCIQISG